MALDELDGFKVEALGQVLALSGEFLGYGLVDPFVGMEVAAAGDAGLLGDHNFVESVLVGQGLFGAPQDV